MIFFFFCCCSKVSRPSIISGTRSNKQNDTDTSGIWFSGFWLLGFPSSRVEHSVPRIADEYLVGTACLDRVGLGSILKRPTLGLACGNSKHREVSCVTGRKRLSSSSLEEQSCMVSGGLGLVSSQA